MFALTAYMLFDSITVIVHCGGVLVLFVVSFEGRGWLFRNDHLLNMKGFLRKGTAAYAKERFFRWINQLIRKCRVGWVGAVFDRFD